MNVKGVAFHATALQQVANDLQKSINQVREPTVGSELDWAKWGYLHHVLDEWFEEVAKPRLHGRC